jgi:hypothetical protein
MMLICLSNGYCVKNSCGCNGESCVCHLNPKDGKQTEFSFACGCVVPLKNRACSYFRVMDLGEHLR